MKLILWSVKANRLLADHYLTIRSESNQELIRQGIWKVGAALFLSVFVGTRRRSAADVAALLHFWCRACCKCWHMTGAHSQEVNTGKFHWVAVESTPHHIVQHRTKPHRSRGGWHMTGVALDSIEPAQVTMVTTWPPPSVLSNHFLHQRWCCQDLETVLIIFVAIFTIYVHHYPDQCLSTQEDRIVEMVKSVQALVEGDICRLPSQFDQPTCFQVRWQPVYQLWLGLSRSAHDGWMDGLFPLRQIHWTDWHSPDFPLTVFPPNRCTDPWVPASANHR